MDTVWEIGVAELRTNFLGPDSFGNVFHSIDDAVLEDIRGRGVLGVDFVRNEVRIHMY